VVSELSIFIDESGDFGTSDPRGYYVLTFVFHPQNEDISEPIQHLDSALADLGIPADRAVHTGALIRGEEEHRGAPINQRKAVFARLFS